MLNAILIAAAVLGACGAIGLVYWLTRTIYHDCVVVP